MPKPLIVIKELFAQAWSHRHAHRHNRHLHPSSATRPFTLTCHVQDALDLSWSPDGYTLLCCSMDGETSHTSARPARSELTQTYSPELTEL